MEPEGDTAMSRVIRTGEDVGARPARPGGDGPVVAASTPARAERRLLRAFLYLMMAVGVGVFLSDPSPPDQIVPAAALIVATVAAAGLACSARP
jgi:hypothetical protein